MNIEQFIDFCQSKSFVSMDTPFGPDTLVFRVHHKIFALTGLDDTEFKVNLKCDPEKAVQLRQDYHDVLPGYHMNKKHWNTIRFDGEIPDKLLLEMVEHSYELVLNSISKKSSGKK